MGPSPHIALAKRSYDVDLGPDRHDFAQLVLPLNGRLLMDVGGRERPIDGLQAAFVEAGAAHSQVGADAAPHSALILDLNPALIDSAIGDRLTGSIFVPIPSAARSLVEYMGMVISQRGEPQSVLPFWTPLILDALLPGLSHPRSRLAGVMAQVRADPGLPWTAALMAQRAGLSVSRLHACFRAELDMTPRAWLSEVRLERVRQWLVETDLPIAELAHRAGYADQSALTRALRRATGHTPSAYRREMTAR